MPSRSKTTTDHEEIRRWVEERGGHPAAVERTRGGRGRGDGTGILRIDFPGYSGEGSLEEISWDEFFEKFDRAKLAFLYQDTTARGETSNFNKLVKRSAVEQKRRGRTSGRRAAGQRGRASRRGRGTRTRRGRTAQARRGRTAARGRGRKGRRATSGNAQKRSRRRRARQSR